MSLFQSSSKSHDNPKSGIHGGASEQIAKYLGTVRRRLQWQTAAQGLGVCGVIALVATVVTVLLANHLRFSDSAITVGTLFLWASLLAALAWFLARPLMRKITDARIARFVEEKHPEFRDQLVTAVELQHGEPSPSSQIFQRILAEEAMRKAPAAAPASLIDSRRIWKPLTWGVASLAIILLLGLFGPGAFRYGTKTLWIGWAQAKVNPLYMISLKPGDVTVSRDADQEILASPVGFMPNDMKLHVLYGKNTSWETAAMLPDDKGPDFHFLLMNIQEPIKYYVEANGVRSPEHSISVIAVPRVTRLEVKFHYPPYAGMEDVVDQAGGDIIALKGTEITLTVHTDAPAPGGRMVMDDNSAITLKEAGDKALVASFKLTKDAMYHVRLEDPQHREARASEEYIIQAVNDMAPTVRLVRPGRDLQPTPVEEVVIGFEAQDDVRMANLNLNYVVNGKEKKTIPLVANGKTQQASASHMIALEDYKLQPGDLVSYFAEAKDAAGNTTTSDMYFLQVRPFERNYTQSQQGGGGGGGGGQQEDSFLSERQKEVISATWNVLRGKDKQRTDQLAEAAEVLSTVQQTVKEQAETLQMRIGRRELSGVNNEFETLAENLKKAVESMDPAISMLKEKKFQDALTPEQSALQYLLRAEASYRDIQVAFGQQGGGGGGGANAGRDLSDLFQLELDTNKNQYETLNQMANPTGGGGMPGQEMDDIMRKLQELARRQQELARRERENQKDSMRSANRWEQEMLRRETEELARKLEQLSRQTNSQQMSQASRALSQAARDMQQANGQQQGQQNGQQQNGQQSGQQSGQQGGQQGQSGQQRAGQNSNGQSGPQQGQQSGQQSGQQGDQQNAQNQGGPRGGSERERALERLREATNALGNQRASSEGQRINEMTGRAKDLARMQGEVADKTRQMAGRGENKSPGPEERQALSETINNKIEMLEQLRQLERDINAAAGRLAGSQRDAATELRGASSHMQDERLSDKIRQGAWLSQRGMWPSAAPVEEELKGNLNELARRLENAQRAMSQGAGDGDKLARALETAERVRQGLEGLGGQQPGQRPGQGQQQGQNRGQQPGQQQGQRGQQNGGQQQGQQNGQGQQAGGQQPGNQQGQGQQPGNQSGQSQQGGQQAGQQGGQQSGGQQSGQQAGMNGGQFGGQQLNGGARGGGPAGTYTGRYGTDYNRGGEWPEYSPDQMREMDRQIGELSREAGELRGLLADDEAFGRMVMDLIRSMQELDGKNFTGNPAELEKLRSELTDKWKELELKLRREMQLGEPEAVRLAGQERVPEKYRSLVEEYYRSLSRKKQ